MEDQTDQTVHIYNMTETRLNAISHRYFHLDVTKVSLPLYVMISGNLEFSYMYVTPGPGIEPGPQWWEASALTTAPTLLPSTGKLCLKT